MWKVSEDLATVSERPPHGVVECRQARLLADSSYPRAFSVVAGAGPRYELASSQPPTTSSPRSTPRSGQAAASSTCPGTRTSRCRCRRTSASTRRIWVSSSGPLIIADEGSRVHYIERCTAPAYSSDSLHSAVVELIAKPGAHIRLRRPVVAHRRTSA